MYIYIYIYIYVCVCVCVCVCIYMYIYTYTYTYTYYYLTKYIRICISIYIYMFVCVYLYMYMYMYTYMCIYMHTHICIYMRICDIYIYVCISIYIDHQIKMHRFFLSFVLRWVGGTRTCGTSTCTCIYIDRCIKFFFYIFHNIQLTSQKPSAEPRNSAGADFFFVVFVFRWTSGTKTCSTSTCI